MIIYTALSKQITDNIVDTYVKLVIISWFWPYFLISNLDNYHTKGITLNGIKHIKC